MVKEIMHDPLFLSQKSEPATEEDRLVIVDLLDTLRAHLDGCVGMAANMIGVLKNIIVVCVGDKQEAFINPVITLNLKPYPAEEGCLSLPGVKKTIRYNEIELEYLDSNFKTQRKKFRGFTAQIIQHEIDHCNGILI